MTRIFVYGTLRKGIYNHDIYLRDHGVYCGDGYIRGSLFTITGKKYPAFLNAGQDLIFGEIYDVDDETLHNINELESYYGQNHVENEYNQIFLDVYDVNGQKIDQAYVYEFNMDKPENVDALGEDILEHDYVQYIQKQKLNDQSLFDDDLMVF